MWALFHLPPFTFFIFTSLKLRYLIVLVSIKCKNDGENLLYNLKYYGGLILRLLLRLMAEIFGVDSPHIYENPVYNYFFFFGQSVMLPKSYLYL